ncbi:Lysine-specific demethylase NO66, partial [Stegodyphus mimosarum]
MSKSRLSTLSAFAVFKEKLQSRKKKLREEVDNEEPELVEAVNRTKRRRYGEKLSDQEEIDQEQDETDSVPDVPIINAPIIIPRRPITVPCGNILAEKVFKWMIDPLQPDKFFDQVFERKPVHISKKNESPDYFKTVMSCKDFDNMMRENFLEYSKHIDVVIYTDGVRKTFNPEGRAYPSSVWKFYREGCSVRMQNPQSYHDNLWKLCSNLQEYFGSYVGAN